MTVTIDVDPTGSEGPVAIEVATRRLLALPPGPVPDLGATSRVVHA
jgi:hypothetical protein